MTREEKRRKNNDREWKWMSVIMLPRFQNPPYGELSCIDNVFPLPPPQPPNIAVTGPDDGIITETSAVCGKNMYWIFVLLKINYKNSYAKKIIINWVPQTWAIKPKKQRDLLGTRNKIIYIARTQFVTWKTRCAWTKKDTQILCGYCHSTTHWCACFDKKWCNRTWLSFNSIKSSHSMYIVKKR